MNLSTFKQHVVAAASIGVTLQNAAEAEEFASLNLGTAAAPTAPATPATGETPHRGRGRPKGSKNKAKKTDKPVKAAKAHRGPGRPKGSKNKKGRKAVAKAAKSSGQRGNPIKPGTSCAAEILGIVSASKAKMSFGEILTALAAKKLEYPKVNVGVALKTLTTDGKLVRTGKVRAYQYRAAKAASKAAKAAAPAETPAPVAAPAATPAA